MFTTRNLSVLAYANGFTLWHYKSHSLASAKETGYFAAAADMLATGDFIMVSGQDGAAILVIATDGQPQELC